MDARPRIVMIEFNHRYQDEFVMEYDPTFVRKGEFYGYGASIESMVKLGNENGYQMVARDDGCNLFFVRNDVILSEEDGKPNKRLLKQ